MDTVLLGILCGVVGLCIGSFLNVVVHRVPRKESVIRPRSHCPSCGIVLANRDNVPVVSWLRLRGRCRSCEGAISIRYPLVELGTATLFVAGALRFGADWALPAYLVFFASLLAISVIDLEHYIIPNRIVYPTIFLSVPLLAVAALAQDDWTDFGHALLGGTSAFLLLLLVHLASPRGMGFGDVRLSFILGLFLGWLDPWVGHVFLGLFLGFLLGSVTGLVLIAIRRRGRKDHIPFGPFLAAGAMLTVLFGNPIIDWYLGR
jgi:leader peptidase (prepilin peptidase)/N-methyltransferase